MVAKEAEAPVIPDLDIYHSVNKLVKQHGEDAPIHAAMRADAMLEAGDLDGYAVWKRILRAVERDSFEGNMSSIQREDTAFYAKRRSASHGNGTRTNSSESVAALQRPRLASLPYRQVQAFAVL